MIVMPAEPGRRDRQTLDHFLTRVGDRARLSGKTHYASITLRVRHIDPLAVLEAIYDPAEQHFYSECPEEGLALAGADAVTSWTGAGAERFVEARLWAERLFSDLIAVGDLEAGSGPKLFASFTFEDEVPPAEQEQGSVAFSAATLFLPRWQVERRQGRYFATANAAIEPGADIRPIAERIWSAHQRFGAFEYGGDPAVSGPVGSGESVPGSRLVMDSAAADNLGKMEGYGRLGRAEEVGDYRSSVRIALERIHRGELDKVVLARALRYRAARPFLPLPCLNRLRERFGSCYAFSVSEGRGASFIGATPERLVQVRHGKLSTEALAGSAPRGRTAREDARLAAGLLGSEKDLREQRMVTESIRRQLEPFGFELSVEDPPVLLRLANVQHLRSAIEAAMPAGGHLLEVAGALHPTPAVGGAPREAALRLIAELEPFHRGLYAGVAGWFDDQGQGRMLVGLRSALVSGQELTAYAGAGIVEGSEPEKEFAETEVKLRALLEGLG